MKDEKRLGAGLGAIFGEDISSAIDAIQNDVSSGVREIDVTEVLPNPYQPRKTFDVEKINELASSIKENGLLTPIVVKQTDTGYVLIAGERRLRACQQLKMETIPAIVKEFTDNQMMELSLLENIQREDLSAIEEAQSYNQLIKKIGYTQDELAQRLGKSRAHVTNILRLLKLPTEVQKMIENHELTMGQARPLITMEKKEDIISLAKKIVKEGLSARQVEKEAKKEEKDPFHSGKDKVLIDTALLNVQQILRRKLATNVTVSDNEIKIKYDGTDDLNRILEIIDCLDD